MGTLTAQILTGTAHPNHGGINPTHYLFLSENSRPVWMLVPHNISRHPGKEQISSMIRWIPSVDNMLEDALLMIAVHVLKDNTLLEKVEKFAGVESSDYVEMNREIDKRTRMDLYALCRRIKSNCKLVITVLEGSSINNQLQVLENYRMDVEVCVPVYLRQYSVWTGKTEESGSLLSLPQL